jgi:hypothetical protein
MFLYNFFLSQPIIFHHLSYHHYVGCPSAWWDLTVLTVPITSHDFHKKTCHLNCSYICAMKLKCDWIFMPWIWKFYSFLVGVMSKIWCVPSTKAYLCWEELTCKAVNYRYFKSCRLIISFFWQRKQQFLQLAYIWM